MAVTQYIGARYVPIFADPAEWSSTKQYEPLTIVLHQGNSFTSKQFVPVGVDINDTDYWAETGNYNAQVEQYRQEVQTFDGRITQNAEDIDAETTARQQADTALQTAINDETAARANADTALQTAINDEAAARANADTALQTNIDSIVSSSGTLAACEYLGTIAYLSEDEVSTWNHCGSICKDSTRNREVIISCQIPQPTDNMGTVKFVSIENDAIYSSKSVELGHANSITYNEETDEFLICPLYLNQNGTTVYINEVWAYNNDFTQKRVINAPNNPSAISRDKITGKIIVEMANAPTSFYELINDEFVLIGEIDIRSDETGAHVQDLACYDNIWYANNTVGNVVYGHIVPFDIIGNFNISEYCNMTGYRLFGEVDGFDFTDDGHLFCTGDYSLAQSNNSYGYIHTVFEIIYPNSKVCPFYYVYHEGMTHTSILLSEAARNKLRQLSEIYAPQLILPMSSQVGSVFRFSIPANTTIITGDICFNEFSEVIVEIQSGGVFECGNIRLDCGELTIKGPGTFIWKHITAPAKNIINVNFGGNIILSPKADPASNYPFENLSTGCTFKCGALQNPRNIKYPQTQINIVSNRVHFVTGSLSDTSGVIS